MLLLLSVKALNTLDLYIFCTCMDIIPVRLLWRDSEIFIFQRKCRPSSSSLNLLFGKESPLTHLPYYSPYGNLHYVICRVLHVWPTLRFRFSSDYDNYDIHNNVHSPTFRIHIQEFRHFFITQLMKTLMLPSIGRCINYIPRETMKTLTCKTQKKRVCLLLYPNPRIHNCHFFSPY
jgi:hypothetical protein